ncbi:MAG: cytidylate kinase family protein [Candidatus Micrarchaeota archaeon]|nr:cytidylate kinase family protein [Candidatus Micrarchaeota archaeon]
MIICISGLSGSGKNAVGAEVAKLLGLRVVDPTFKTIAAKQKMTLMEFHRKAEHEHSIDRHFDAHLVAEAKRGNCVVTTWLGPWMVKDADIRVWLYAPREVRARRVAGRDAMSQEQALAHINDRDESNHHRYNEVYKINIYDHSGFELVINTEKFVPAQTAQIIAAAARAVGGKKAKIAAKKIRKGKKNKKR